MDKVLVLDCITRKGLTVARALGKEGIEVHCLSHKAINPARFSKYTKKFYLSPNPENKYEFRKFLVNLLEKNNYSCIIPLEEDTIKSLYLIRNQISKLTSYKIVQENTFDIANDKWKTLCLAQKLNIPCPESYCPKTEKELEGIVKKLGFPLIIKPRQSSGSRGLKKVNNISELKKQYSIISKDYKFPIIQECIDKKGQGILSGFIFRDGEVVADFTYERIREYPVNGGPGTMWVSVENRQVRQYGEKLLEKLNWEGVAMVEFKFDYKRKGPVLMEINPRFWGSLALAVKAGVNFPYIYYLLSKNKKIVKQKYKTGIKCRWLIPGDLMHFISNPARFKLKPSFFNFFDKNTYYDEFSFSDIPGSIGSIIFAFANLFDLDIWRKAILRQ